MPGNRHFSFSPGNYPVKGKMTSLICKSRCSKWDMTYIGLTQGDYCFCSKTLPDDAMKSSNATMDCSVVSQNWIFITTSSVTITSASNVLPDTALFCLHLVTDEKFDITLTSQKRILLIGINAEKSSVTRSPAFKEQICIN